MATMSLPGTDVNEMSRAAIIDILENAYSTACYEEDSIDDLRYCLVNAVRDPCMDGVICDYKKGDEYCAHYYYRDMHGTLPPLYLHFLGTSRPDAFANLATGWTLIEIVNENADVPFYYESP